MNPTDSAPPLCSVCIANYNGMRFLDACLASLQAQTCRFPFEIIIHDDASTDDSVAHVRSHYPQVRLIESRENVGFCISNNRMVEAARGRYVLLLNNDATLFPDALHALFEAAERTAGPALLSLPQYDAANGTLIDRGSHLDLFLNPQPNLDPAQEDVAMLIGACLWCPRAIWQELGGFPDWFGSLAEDMLLCLAARLHGIPVRVLPHSGFHHWVGQSLGGGKVVAQRLRSRISRRIVSERNKTFVMLLVYPPLALLCLLPLHLLLLLAEGVILSLLKHQPQLFRLIYLAVPQALWQYRHQCWVARQRLRTGTRIGGWAFLRTFRLFPHKLRLLLRHGVPELR